MRKDYTRCGAIICDRFPNAVVSVCLRAATGLGH
jgi:hypothetical protein